MEPRRSPSRRRNEPVRWPGQRTTTKVDRKARATSVLAEWRSTLAKLEREAAQYRCAEVQMLLGVAALAVEDLMQKQQPKQADSNAKSV